MGPATALGGAATATKPAVTPSKSISPTDNATESPAETSGENTVVAPTAEKKTEKARSQSRKRQSIFGKFVAKKDEVEEKREVKKEEKAEKKAEKAEEKEVMKTDKAEEKEEKEEEKTVMKEEKKAEKAEAKEEKKEEKAEKKAEKEAKKEGEIAAPISKSLISKLAPSILIGKATVDSETSKMGAPSSAAPKSNKRNSVFGSFFNKKETPKEKEKELAPAVPAKEAESAPVTATVPQTEEPTVMGSEEPMMNVATPKEATTENPTASASAGEMSATKATATTPDTKEKRRQSFFNLGGKKEKKSEAISDTEGAEKSGSATAKLGNVFRRASRSAKPTSSTVTDSGTPPSISKDTDTAAEPALAGSMAAETNPAATENSMSDGTPAAVSASA